MRKLLILATATLLIGSSAFTIDNSKKKAKAKKESCARGKHCSKNKSKTASI
jgi:hypothetical protein